MLLAQSNLKDATTATIFGRATDNVQVAEVTVDGEPVSVRVIAPFLKRSLSPVQGCILIL